MHWNSVSDSYMLNYCESDSSISDSYTPSEDRRPTITSVFLMLGSETALMPEPRSPGFSLARSKDP